MNTTAKTTYTLKDDFNNYVLSRHRTIAAAVLAQLSHSRRLKKTSHGTYINYSITASTGEAIHDEIYSALCRVQNSR